MFSLHDGWNLNLFRLHIEPILPTDDADVQGYVNNSDDHKSNGQKMQTRHDSIQTFLFIPT